MQGMEYTTTMLIAFALLVILSGISIVRLFFSPNERLPQNRWPLILTPGVVFYEYIKDMMRKYGPGLYKLNVLPFNLLSLYVVTDVDVAKQILTHRTKFDISSNMIDAFKTVMPNAFGGMRSNDTWKHQRELTGPAVSGTILQDVFPTFTESCAGLIERWKATHFASTEERKSKPVDVLPDITSFILFLLTSSMFGLDISEMSGEKFEQLRKALMTTMDQFLLDSGFAGFGARKIPKAEIDSALGLLHRLALAQIKRSDKMENVLSKPSLLDKLVSIYKNDDPDFSYDTVRDICVGAMIVGQETLAITTLSVLQHICENPEVQKKLVNEIRTKLQGKKAPTFTDIEELKYLDCVIKETQRFCPIASFISRAACEDIELAGATLKKDSNILISTYAIHRCSKYWEDPDTFKPERFESFQQTGDKMFAFLPFGGGHRVCIGKTLAYTIMKVVLTTLLNEFTFNLERPVEMDVRLVTGPKELLVSINRDQ